MNNMLFLHVKGLDVPCLVGACLLVVAACFREKYDNFYVKDNVII